MNTVSTMHEGRDAIGSDLVFAWLAAAALLLVKSPDALSHAQFWAEDGAVFFAEQFGNDRPRWFTPYAGYLHFIPRLVAWIGNLFPIERQPLIYNATAIAIDAFCIAYVAMRATWTGRIGVVFLSFFVVPTAGDLFGTLTNVQWFLQFVLLAACTRRDGEAAKVRFRLADRVTGALLLSAALTGPFSLLWVLLLSVRLLVASCIHHWASRDARATGRSFRSVGDFLKWDRFAILCVGAVVQATVMLGQKIRTPESAFGLPEQSLAALGVVKRDAYVWIVSHPFADSHLVLLAFYVGCLALAAGSAWRDRTSRSWSILTLMILGCLEPVMAFVKQEATHPLGSPSHYFFLWGVGSVWVAAETIEKKLAIPARIVPLVLASVFVLGLSLRPDYFRRAPLVDLDWPGHARAIRSRQAPHVVPLNPLPWGMVID